MDLLIVRQHRKITPLPAQYGHHKSKHFSLFEDEYVFRMQLIIVILRFSFNRFIEPFPRNCRLECHRRLTNDSRLIEKSYCLAVRRINYSHQTQEQWKAANVSNGFWRLAIDFELNEPKWKREKALAAKTQALTYLSALRIETTKSINSIDRHFILLFLKCRTKFSLLIYLFLL